MTNKLVHCDIDGNEMFSVFLYEPKALCSTNDGGAWTIDNKFKIAYRYNEQGVLVKQFDVGRRAYVMEADGKDGFFVASREKVMRFNSDGIKLIELPINDVFKINVNGNKVMLYNQRSESVYIIDLNKGTILKRFDTGKSYRSVPTFFTIDFRDLNQEYFSFPLTYDPVWGENEKLPWIQIDNGFFLDKGKYYQFKVKLISNNGINSPILKRLGITKGIKFKNILSGESKNVYIKNLPHVDLSDASYNINLNCIWKSINGY